MNEPALENFRLAGGTALALQKGHRHSDDLDLFTDQEFNTTVIEEMLREKFTDGYSLKISPFSFGASEEVKIDIMNFHSEPFLSAFQQIDGVRISSWLDIAAMKLQAITSRKHRKDFIDLFVLQDEFTLKEVIELFERRFVFYDKKDVVIALSNIDEADAELMPKMFVQVRWDTIKEQIKKELSAYIKKEIA